MRSILLALLGFALAPPAQAQAIEWTNGHWFDGKAFAQRSFYSVDGALTAKRPVSIDRTVDLSGKFVVPAFGDAHHHGIDSADGLDAKIAQFLQAGIFYVKNPNVIPALLTREVREKINMPGSIDVVFSNGGLTATGGHPVKLHASLAARGVFKGLGTTDMENSAYFIIDNAQDLASKWPRIRVGNPDFIKTFLLFSDTSAKHTQAHEQGLDPQVLKAIVARAHEDGLRVTTHIETAADFRNALLAGVNEITHLPIPDRAVSPDLDDYLIDAPTARLAADRQVTVVATANIFDRPAFGVAGPSQDAAYLSEIRANQRSNLRQLVDAGVRIAIGSDGISGEQPMVTALDEAMYLHRNGFFDSLSLLKMWTENTAATIFPGRKIGHLREGYEASFLVLEADPLADFANVRKISLRVKQGCIVNSTASLPFSSGETVAFPVKRTVL